MMKNLKKKKGFTLIELIIVIAILGIIAAIAIPRFGNAQEGARIRADIASGKVIADAASWVLAEGGTLANGQVNETVNNDLSEKLQNIPEPQLDVTVTTGTPANIVFPAPSGLYNP